MIFRTLATVTAFALAQACVAAPASPLAIPLPDGGWDYASVDAATSTLYVARTDGIDAIDLKTRVVRRLAPAARAHAVMPLPGLKVLLETDGTSGSVRLIDTASGAELNRIPTGEKPDAAVWDAPHTRAIVMNAKSGTVSIVDPAAAKVVATVALDPGLESGALDSRGLLFVNNEDLNRVTMVDLSHNKRVGDIALTGCKGPTGMAYAPWVDRIVAVCGNGVAAIIDAKARKLVASLAIGKGPDAAIADAARRAVYVPSGDSGDLAVIVWKGAQASVVRRIATAKGARTGALDPATGLLYLPTADYAAPVAPATRRTLVPGSVRVLVVTP